MATSVWSSADAAANGMTLSNGGLTVTVPAGSVGWRILRSSLSKTSGKLYLEVTTSTGTVDTAHSGLASSGVNIGSYLGDSNYSFGSSILYGDLFVSTGFVTGVNSQAFKSPITSTDVMGIAVDFTTNKVWVSINNIWNGSANPSTGNSPAASFTPATVGPLFFAMSFNTATTGARDAPTTWTLQPTAASQKYAPPSGFSAWDPPANPAQDYLARTVGGNEGGNAANITALIDGLVSDGVWAKLDCLYVLAQQNATDSLLNLIGTNYPLTGVGRLRLPQAPIPIHGVCWVLLGLV